MERLNRLQHCGTQRTSNAASGASDANLVLPEQAESAHDDYRSEHRGEVMGVVPSAEPGADNRPEQPEEYRPRQFVSPPRNTSLANPTAIARTASLE